MKIPIQIFLSILFFSCGQNQDNFESFQMPDSRIISTVKLSKQLSEISGLTFNDKNELFAHNDEKSLIYQLDYNSGEILKQFKVGQKTQKEDFEGITFANGKFYMVTSNGDLYEFSEGENDEEVSYKKYKTFLDNDNDVEGLCCDPKNNSLLLACKGNPGKKYKGNRAVYEFSLNDKKLKKKPRFLLPVEDIMEKYNLDFVSKLGEFFLIKDNTFAPSGIEFNPTTGNFYILSFKGRMIVEITDDGKIVNQYILNPKQHRQPEGITFSKDNKMIISDEAAGKKPTITVYNLD
jgi:uncharacterized protein YjiK